MREILHLLPKPSHYAGMEDGACIKDSQKISLHIALAFPDTYEIGMSYLGQKILYGIVNSQPCWWAERVMAPEAEAAEIMRAHKTPLATLESDTPLAELAAVCFSVTHELCYTDLLQMLDLAAIPIYQHERSQNLHECPVIIAGGGAMIGAEAVSPFLDLVALGDGEELLPEILTTLEQARTQGLSRQEFLLQAQKIPGVYVPSLFVEQKDGSLVSTIPGYRPARRIVTNLENCAYPVTQVAPIGAIHNRLSLEIARGCTRGCRFCHAGMVYRPVRERQPETIARLLDQCLDNTGFDEVSFLALSAGDCTALRTIHASAHERCQKEQISLGLPSLRVGSVDDSIMAKLASLRRPGCTLAPEAGSQRLRDVINKGITEQELMLHLQKLLEHGWRQVKLYFMIGLPTETDEDLDAITDLCRKARDAGGPGAPKLQITAAISPFVPKPFTPFQWEAQIDLPEITRRINYLRAQFKSLKNIKLKWHEPEVSHLEGILSRAGRNMAPVIEKAWRKGAIFCSWTDRFQLQPWLEAMTECGIAPEAAIAARNREDNLPWSHIEAGVSSDFLWREREKAYAEKVTADCRTGACGLCGACDTKAMPSLLAHQNKAGHILVFPERDQQAHQPAQDENGRLLIQQAQSERPKLNAMLTNKAGQYRLWHRKTGPCAFLSHLELQAVLTRALRRANAPVAFSQGFHPLPLISFGRALPVGAESEAEWFGLTLHTYLPPHKLVKTLNPFLHDGLAIGYGELAEKRADQAISEVFSLIVPDQLILQAAGCFADFSSQESFLLTRETKKGEKTEDIRRLLLNWKISSNQAGQNLVFFTTDWSQGYLSPILLAQTILKPLEDFPIKILKNRQIFASGQEYWHLGKAK